MAMQPFEYSFLKSKISGFDIYEVYQADKQEEAIEFLEQISIASNQYYVVIETKNKIIAKDINGIYYPSETWRGSIWNSKKWTDPDIDEHKRKQLWKHWSSHNYFNETSDKTKNKESLIIELKSIYDNHVNTSRKWTRIGVVVSVVIFVIGIIYGIIAQKYQVSDEYMAGIVFGGIFLILVVGTTSAVIVGQNLKKLKQKLQQLKWDNDKSSKQIADLLMENLDFSFQLKEFIGSALGIQNYEPNTKRENSSFEKSKNLRICPICGSIDVIIREGYQSNLGGGRTQFSGVTVIRSHCNKCKSVDNVVYICNSCESYLCNKCY